MHPHHSQRHASRHALSVASSRPCDTDRVRYLHLVAAARASAIRPANRQQIADIVRVTVDDEVDTTTFRAIVSDVTPDTLH